MILCTDLLPPHLIFISKIFEAILCVYVKHIPTVQLVSLFAEKIKVKAEGNSMKIRISLNGPAKAYPFLKESILLIL